jgi:hypothetical protein
MTPAQYIMQMAALGLPAEHLPAALEMLETMLDSAKAPYEAYRVKERERKREWRELKGLSRPLTGHDGTKTDVDIHETETSRTVPDSVPHIDNYTTTRNNTDKSVLIQTAPSKHERRISRGTRLPADFSPLPNILELGRSLDLTDDEYWQSIARFKDHFPAQPGQRGIKLDWQATCRNWIRETADRKKAKTHGSNRTASPNSRYNTADSVRQAFDYIDRQMGCGKESGDTDSGELPRLRQNTA